MRRGIRCLKIPKAMENTMAIMHLIHGMQMLKTGFMTVQAVKIVGNI
jgi:hypothetical protein